MKCATPVLKSLCLGIALIGLSSAGAVLASDLTDSCDNCHGKDGASKESDIPIIGGLSAPYITDSFSAYKDEARPCKEVKYIAGPHKGEASDMCKVAKDLSDDDITQVADHYAALPFVRAVQETDAALAKTGESVHETHCRKCHDEGGSLASDDAGILAGQWMPFLTEQFDAFKSGKREMSKKMKAKMDKVSEEDIKALVQYYGSFK